MSLVSPPSEEAEPRRVQLDIEIPPMPEANASRRNDPQPEVSVDPDGTITIR